MMEIGQGREVKEGKLTRRRDEREREKKRGRELMGK